MYTLQLLLVAKVFSDIQRNNDGFKADFSITNKGRLYNILIHHENLDFGECLIECIRFLNCVTFNYHSESKTCELTDEDFDWYEADVDTPGWYNYGTPPKVEGGFSEWIQKSPCSPTCGDNNGQQIETRSCKNPEPKFGGADCVGEKTRVVFCKVKSCPIDGGFSAWTQNAPCSPTCGDNNGQQIQTRSCTNPEPKFGGADCVGEKTRVVPCKLKPCPIDGGFTEWRSSGPCSATCGYEGKQMQTRECTNPKPKNGGAECVGEKIRYGPCKDVKPCLIVSCEGLQLKLSCPEGKKIKILGASYGRSDKTTCTHSAMSNTNCHAAQSKSVMEQACNGENSCSIDVNSSKFGGDPCGGTFKYLSVRHKCE